MDRKLLFKILLIGLMALLLLIPLALVQDQIRDRSYRQLEVQEYVAASAAGEQRVVGPVLAIQYLETIDVIAEVEATQAQAQAQAQASSRPALRRKVVERTLLIAPDELDIDGTTTVETRQRGIYPVRLFHLDASARGKFSVRPPDELLAGKSVSQLRAALVFFVSDPRGITNNPQVTINGKHYRFDSPTADGKNGLSRLSIDLGPVDPKQALRFDVSLPLQLMGTARLSFAPVGESNRIHLSSDWPHPNFGGRFLPTERRVEEKGFEARWDVSHLARNFDATLDPHSGEVMNIGFIDPVNVYLQSERAVKYGILFIVLTFAGFFLTETLRRAPIHPLQYLLVGLALAIFFLLLVAFSEHMPFAAAYGIAAVACIGLIAWYLSGAFGGWRQGAAFGGALTGLYGVLYGVLLSEDNALLMGSLLMFLALGIVMLTTRRLNWYKLGERQSDAGQ